MGTNSCLNNSFGSKYDFSNLIEPSLNLFRNYRGQIDWVAVINLIHNADNLVQGVKETRP